MIISRYLLTIKTNEFSHLMCVWLLPVYTQIFVHMSNVNEEEEKLEFDCVCEREQGFRFFSLFVLWVGFNIKLVAIFVSQSR